MLRLNCKTKILIRIMSCTFIIMFLMTRIEYVEYMLLFWALIPIWNDIIYMKVIKLQWFCAMKKANHLKNMLIYIRMNVYLNKLCFILWLTAGVE